MNLGAAFTGGNGTRRANDFYPTPREATLALLQETDVPRHVWEPACGDGAISRVLHDYGRVVVSTDLNDYGFGRSGVDFLTAPPEDLAIVTNPPFNLAAEFIKRARYIGATYMALLLKSTFWNAKGRLPLFSAWPPNGVHPLTWRLDFTGRGRPTMDCMWVVWDSAATGSEFRPFPKPVTDMLA